jgi:hypothetical protein
MASKNDAINAAWSRLGWYRARLAAMSWGEISHRLVEASKKWTGRRFARGWERVAPVSILAPCPRISNRLAGISPKLAAAIACAAEDVRSGCFNLLGACWPRPESMPPPSAYWHLDPAGGYWPDQNAYCFDISFRHGVGVREVKRIWEINRLQFLVPLAVDSILRNDLASRSLISALVFSWMDGNPPYRGLNWASPIELSLRLISVAIVFSILGTDHLDESEQASLGRFFEAHAFWIGRYPSLYSSANNHRVAELSGLIVATSFAPGIKLAKSIRERSLTNLLKEMERQILPDGVGAEQAPSYSAFTIELFLVALIFANLQATELPERVRERIAAWADHVRWMMDGQGRLPAIGDCDDCRVVALMQAPEPLYVASIAAAVVAFLGRGDLAPPAHDPHIRDFLFEKEKPGSQVEPGLRTWKSGGYTIVRANSPKRFVLTLDHGPVGYLSIAAHGHADALAVWLSVSDRPVIVDAGTYLYHSLPDWRKRFRCTPLHNSLAILGESSSQPSGPFNWATKANARLVSAESAPRPRVIAEHDGYLARYGVTHRRTVELPDQKTIVITDQLLSAPSEERVIIAFLIDTSCRAEVSTDGSISVSTTDGHALVRLTGNDSLRPRVVHGDESSGLGWLSPSFGIMIPTDQILFEGFLREPSEIKIELI